MADHYATKGSKNHIEKVAIVGVTGSVGEYITKALIAKGSFKVTAITREDSTAVVPAGVTAAKVDYSKQESLVEALKGQDALIITMGVTAPPDTQSKLIEAAAAAEVSWIIPNEWGFDQGIGSDGILGGMRERALKIREYIESLGKSSWIGVTCGFWYEFSLAGSAYRYGFDFHNKKVIFFDDGTAKINTSSWPQCGNGVANLLALKILPESQDDKSTTLSQFKNNDVRIASFRVSQKDMFASVLRVTGDKESDWKIEHENSKERYDAGGAMLQQGNREGFAQLMYTRVFFPDGAGDFETRSGLDNKALGLVNEDLDHYTKIAVEMAKAGTKY